MRAEYHFYMDDSGSRDPDRNRNTDTMKPDWFALGGLLINSADVTAAKDAITAFRARWGRWTVSRFGHTTFGTRLADSVGSLVCRVSDIVSS